MKATDETEIAVDTSLSDPRANRETASSSAHEEPGIRGVRLLPRKRGPCELWPAVASRFQTTRTSSRVKMSA